MGQQAIPGRKAPGLRSQFAASGRQCLSCPDRWKGVCPVRHLGAVKANDAEAARARAKEAAMFARAAAEHGPVLQEYAKQVVETLSNLSEEDRGRLEKTFDGKYLPQLEKDILLKRLGFNQKQVDPWAKVHAMALPLLLKNPELAGAAVQRMMQSLDKLAGELEALAGK